MKKLTLKYVTRSNNGCYYTQLLQGRKLSKKVLSNNLLIWISFRNRASAEKIAGFKDFIGEDGKAKMQFI